MLESTLAASVHVQWEHPTLTLPVFSDCITSVGPQAVHYSSPKEWVLWVSAAVETALVQRPQCRVVVVDGVHRFHRVFAHTERVAVVDPECGNTCINGCGNGDIALVVWADTAIDTGVNIGDNGLNPYIRAVHISGKCAK